jgi:hypothetical protein
LIIEELLATTNGGVPIEYTFHCFHGRVRFIKIWIRTPVHREDIYLPDWTRVPIERRDRPVVDGAAIAGDVQAPPRLSEMIEIAECLSNGVDFVRVDLYNLGDRIVFRELTNYPSGGTNPEFDTEAIAGLSASWQPRYGWLANLRP